MNSGGLPLLVSPIRGPGASRFCWPIDRFRGPPGLPSRRAFVRFFNTGPVREYDAADVALILFIRVAHACSPEVHRSYPNDNITGDA